MKEFCKCGHSKRSHVMDFNNTRCCCMWQVKEDKEDFGSLLRACECMAYEPENFSLKEALNLKTGVEE